MATRKKVVKEEENFEENIRNYGSKIEHIEIFSEAVRKLPGEYIGAIGNVGWKACIREIFQNSVDECIRKESPCHYVKLMFDERNQSAVVEDTGRGIPLGQIIDIYASEHTSSNYTKELYQYTSGVHGVGAGVAMALSKKFDVRSFVLGSAKHVHFDSGYVWDKGELDIECPPGRQGSSIYMEPDLDVLGLVNLTCDDIRDLVLSIYPLTNIGDQIDFVAVDIKGKIKYNEQFVNRDGIYTILNTITQTPLITPIYFKDDTGVMKAEIAFTYDSSDLTSGEYVVSYANFTRTTENGYHVSGFIDGLCQYFRQYMNKIYLGEKSKISIVNGDIKTGLKAVINSAHLNPIFVGQAKGMLNNQDMYKYVKDLTITSLENWAKTSPGELQKVCKFIKEIAEIRVKSDDSKIKLSNNYESSALTGKPKKYVEASGNKNLELIIVEGDSALGSAKNSRDNKCQALFPIRGKLPNAFKESKAKFLSNQEVASIISIIGGGYGKNFDISKVKFDKVIFLTDADPDGSHIAGLLLRFFLMYLPEMITAGRVYKAVPPLFGIKQRGSMKYFTTKLDFTKYIQGLFAKNYSLSNLNGKKLSNNEITDIFSKNIEYKDQMDFVSTTFAIDPNLLETFLYYMADYIDIGVIRPKKSRKKKEEDTNDIPVIEGSVSNTGFNYSISSSFNLKALAKHLKKKYRFIEVVNDNGSIRIQGLVNSRYQYIFLNDKFFSHCLSLFMMIKNNGELYYLVNGEKNSLYNLMVKFDAMIPSGLIRYKGLGEQNPEELGVSALRPDGDRTLIRYTMESAKEEIESLKRIDSNMSSLLRDIKITKNEIE